MKNYILLFGALLITNLANAATWECIDSSNGHKYRVSQDVASDICRKISNIDLRSAEELADTSDHSELSANDIATKYTHSDSFCVKLGGLTASAARILALGGTEESLLVKNKRMVKEGDRGPAARRVDEITKEMLDNMVAYVYTVKLPPESARMVGYKKCIAGDFD